MSQGCYSAGSLPTPGAAVRRRWSRYNGMIPRSWLNIYHQTALNEFYRVAFRKKLYASIADFRNDLDPWIRNYNEERPHQGRWCFGQDADATFLDAIPIAKKK
jgi:transposase InsO family protein